MTNDNTRTKAHAVFFSVLMVLSMVAVGFAVAPAAATSGNSSDDIRPNTSQPTKDVNTTVTGAESAIVYQGEAINFTGSFDGVGSVTGVSGSAEGQVIDLSRDIPTDQTTGTYSANGSTPINDNNAGFTVLEPAITEAEVRLLNQSNDVSEVNPGTSVEAYAEWNFGDAENVSLTVEDASGTDITNQVLNSSAGNQTLSNASGDRALLELSGEDAGEYTVIFEGSRDLDYGDVVQEYTITKTNDDTVSLELAESSATQGDNVEYTVSGGTDGETYLVAIENGDYRDNVGSDAANIFRNVGDTTETGENTSNTDYAYAVVEIDGTQATGSIETQFLDDSDITVDVYDERSAVADISQATSLDDQDLTVEEGDLTLTSPSGTYAVGETVDVNGTAESADQVRLYAKNNDNWEIVELNGNKNISVESDDTFEVEDVSLTADSASGNDILSFAGTYSIGVISTSDAIASGGNSINTSAWTSATSTRDSLTVVEGDLSGEFLTISGQVARPDDAVDVQGAALGQDKVVIAFVGERGTTQTHTVSVDDDGTFDEDDLSVSDLNQGAASAHIISLGRDGTVGDGSLPNITNSDNFNGSSDPTPSDLAGYIDALDNTGSSLSGNQVRDRIVAQTLEADATDDLMVSQTFRLNDGQISIDSAYPEGSEASGINPVAAGDTMVVTGTTNRQPDDNTIVVNLYNEEGNSITAVSTEEWGTDGQYSVTIDTSDVETGTYSLEADTGQNTDRAVIELVESVEEETTEEETEEETTEEETTEEETTEEETEEETTEEETTEEETTEEETEEEATDDSTPGFGALVALVALVAAALLATRRRDE
jgi:major cell surface glycoprotein (TIGR04216 family)